MSKTTLIPTDKEDTKADLRRKKRLDSVQWPAKKNEVAEKWGTNLLTAKSYLEKLVREGFLIRHSGTYYLPGQEIQELTQSDIRQEERLKAVLWPARSAEAMEAWGVSRTSAGSYLRLLIEKGYLLKHGNLYYLPTQERPDLNTYVVSKSKNISQTQQDNLAKERLDMVKWPSRARPAAIQMGIK